MQILLNISLYSSFYKKTEQKRNSIKKLYYPRIQKRYGAQFIEF